MVDVKVILDIQPFSSAINLVDVKRIVKRKAEDHKNNRKLVR